VEKWALRKFIIVWFEFRDQGGAALKMIVAIIRDLDYDSVTTALTHANFRVTCIAAHGGFLKRKICTLYIGIDDDQVQTVK